MLATGRGVFELTAFQEEDLMGREVVEALTLSSDEPVKLVREWGVRQMGKELSIRTRAGIEKDVTVDLFPAYDDDGGLLVALTPRRTWPKRPSRRFRRNPPRRGSTDRDRRGRSLRTPDGVRRTRGVRARSAGGGSAPSRLVGTSFIRSRSIFTGSSSLRQAEPLGQAAHVRVDDDALGLAALGRDDVRRLPRDAGKAQQRRRTPSAPRRRSPRSGFASCRAATSPSAGRSPVWKMSRSSSSCGTAR